VSDQGYPSAMFIGTEAGRVPHRHRKSTSGFTGEGQKRRTLPAFRLFAQTVRVKRTTRIGTHRVLQLATKFVRFSHSVRANTWVDSVFNTSRQVTSFSQ
jgi:hypothetical protein